MKEICGKKVGKRIYVDKLSTSVNKPVNIKVFLFTFRGYARSLLKSYNFNEINDLKRKLINIL